MVPADEDEKAGRRRAGEHRDLAPAASGAALGNDRPPDADR
jgi:hypothetical protein